MYLSKYIRRCDFMDNMNTMDFNQKIDVSLRASLEELPSNETLPMICPQGAALTGSGT